jgi:hypothetical protein
MRESASTRGQLPQLIEPEHIKAGVLRLVNVFSETIVLSTDYS